MDSVQMRPPQGRRPATRQELPAPVINQEKVLEKERVLSGGPVARDALT